MYLRYIVPAGASVGFIFTTSNNISIDWGDGNTSTVDDSVTTDYKSIVPHTYTTAGRYDVFILGTSLGSFGDPNNNQVGIQYLERVNGFGDLGITSLAGAFRGTSTLNYVYDSLPSTVTNLSYMFYGSTYNIEQTIVNWNTSNVNNMSYMFYGANSFNQELIDWNTSAVTNMSNMFAGATAFNSSLSFVTTNVTDMSRMFEGATAFNQPLTFNIGNVTNMSNMFSGATAFDQPLTFNGTSVTSIDMSNMFFGATSFNKPFIFVSLAGNLSNMFAGATSFNSSLSFDTSDVTDMGSMFYNASSFNQPLNFSTSAVTNMSNMFEGATSFNQPLTFDTSDVTDMSRMFEGATTFNQPLTFNIGNVANMSRMFFGATSFNQPLDFFTFGVTDMSRMFYGATSFNQNLSTWDVQNVSDMTDMFINSGLLTDYFDDMLNEWSLLPVSAGVPLGAPTRSYYSNTGFATLTGTYGWNISVSTVIINPTTIQPEQTFNYTTPITSKYAQIGTTYELLDGETPIATYTADATSGSYVFNDVSESATGLRTFTIQQQSTPFTVIDSFYVNVIIGQGFSLTYTIPDGGATVGLYLGNAVGATIFWGDGNSTVVPDNQTTTQYTNPYTTAGQYNIVIGATSLNSFGYADDSSAGIEYLTSVNDFGDLGITSLAGAFQYATNNFTVPATLPSSVTNLRNMFYNAILFDQDLTSWNMTNVSNMEGMFSNAFAFNNGGVALGWIDIGTTASSAVIMSFMFANAQAFNQDISSWNTLDVSNMTNMFIDAEAFNQDISTWNTSNVSDMSNMFTNAIAFNQNLSNWTISEVLDMQSMFSGSGLLTDNFDNMLNAWSSQTVQQEVTLNAPTRSSYSNSGYNILTNATNQWTIGVEADVTYELTNFNRTFTYTNSYKPTVSGSTYQLLYGSTLLSTFIANETSGTTYTFENVVLNTPGILVFTIQEVIFNNARSQGQRLGETYTIIDSVNVTVNTICFKEGSKILCFKNNVEKYVPIENVRKGDLVKTRLNGYVPVHMIGKSQMYHKKTSERRKEQLYTCSKEKFEEVFEDLVITGCHSILVDEFTSEKQKEKAIEINSGRICITDDQYRVPACVDDRTTIYEKEGLYTIYHLALENDDYYMNYGIYANGLLVETSSKRYLKDLSGMELIE